MDAQAISIKHKKHPKRRFIIIAVIISASILAIVWALSGLSIIPSFLAVVISAFAAVFSTVFALLPLIPSQDRSEVPIVSFALAPSSDKSASCYRGIIGLPPPSDSKTIQQRIQSVKEIYSILTQSSITAVVLAGIGGIGKSTLAALVYRYIEAQLSTVGSPFTAPSLWLRIDPAVTLADIFGSLCTLLNAPVPDLSTLTPSNQAAALFNLLNTAGKARLVVLDQFENVLDDEGHALADRPGIGEWLDALNSQPCACRILLTCRPDPQGARKYPQTYLQIYHVEGLNEDEGIELLQKWDVQASKAEMRMAIQRCNGHALSLTLLASLLAKRQLTLTMLLEDSQYTYLWAGDIAQELLNTIYKELDSLERELLASFSVYREPVLLDAALALMDIEVSITKLHTATIDALLAQHLLDARGAGRYQPHAIVAEYAQSHIIEGSEQVNQQALLEMHAKAAQYYLKRAKASCPPSDIRHKVADIHELIEAVWQYCHAEQQHNAYELMVQERIFDDLHLWGDNAILLELCKILLAPSKWQSESLQLANIDYYMGEVYRSLGQPELGLRYSEESLVIFRKIKVPQREGLVLNSLGRIYNALWQKDHALECYLQALEIFESIEDANGESIVLNNLGRVYWDLGKGLEAFRAFEKALGKSRKVGNRHAEGRSLHGLGMVYTGLRRMSEAQNYFEKAIDALRSEGDRAEEGKIFTDLGVLFATWGKMDEAFQASKKALMIHREIGSRGWEGMTLINLGVLYHRKSNLDISLACFLLARDIFEKGQSPDLEAVQSSIDDLRNQFGEERFIALLAQIEPIAQQIVAHAIEEV